MNCPYCAADAGADGAFCPQCGAKLPRPAAPVPEDKTRARWRKKRLRVPFACVLVLGLALAGLGFMNRSAKPKGVCTAVISPDAAETLLLYNGEAAAGFSGVGAVCVTSSLDGSTLCLHLEDGTLQLMWGADVKLAAQEVYAFSLSLDGSTLACISRDMTLTVYDTATLESRRVGKDVYGAALSPNGSTLAYYTLDSGGDITAWLYDGKGSRKLASDRIPFALSNGGKVIYCTGPGAEKLYALNPAGESTRLASRLEAGSGLLLSGDHTQLVFCDGGVLKLTRKGSEPMAIGKGSALTPVLPQHSAAVIRQEAGLRLTTVPGALTKRFYRNQGVVFWLDADAAPRLVTRELAEDALALCADGKILFALTEKGTILTVTASRPDSPRILAAGVSAFRATPEGNALYFMDAEGALWYQKLPGTPVLLGEEGGTLHMTASGRCLILDGEGRVWLSHRGSAPVVCQTGVTAVHTNAQGICFWLQGQENSFLAVEEGHLPSGESD